MCPNMEGDYKLHHGGGGSTASLAPPCHTQTLFETRGFQHVVRNVVSEIAA